MFCKLSFVSGVRKVKLGGGGTLGCHKSLSLAGRRLAAVMLVGGLSLWASLADADTFGWTGTTNGNMSGDATNWGSLGIPGSGDVAWWNTATYTNAPTASAAMDLGKMLFDTSSGSLTFGSGASTLTLHGISDGTTNIGIQLNAGSGTVSTGSAKFAIAASQTWLNNSANPFTVNGTITNTANSTPYTLTIDGSGSTKLNNITNGGATGTLSLIKTGSGTLTITGSSASSTYTGSTTITGGTLISGGVKDNNRGISNTSTIYLGDTTGNAAATVELSPGSTTGYSNNVVVQSGNTGTMLLYLGRLLNFPGTITLGSSNSAGHDLTIEEQSWPLSFNAAIQDPAGMTPGTGGILTVKADNSTTITFNAANTYTGNTRIAAGTLILTNALALQNSTLDMHSGDAGTLTPNQNSTLGGLMGSRNVNMNAKTLSIGNNGQNTTYSGILSNGSLTKIGTGTLTLSNASNADSGTTISNGTLAISSPGRLSATSGALALGGGALDLGTTTQTVGAVSITAAAGSGDTIQNGSLSGTSYTVSNATGNAVISANLQGTGATLNKSGAGTLTLAGANTYSGATTINGGMLQIGQRARWQVRRSTC